MKTKELTWKPQRELSDIEKFIGRSHTQAENDCMDDLGPCEGCTCGWGLYLKNKYP